MSVIGFNVNGDLIQYNYPNLDNKPTLDATPTANSTNAVQSGGVKSALDALQAQIPAIDPTLSQSGQPADAAETGKGIKASVYNLITYADHTEMTSAGITYTPVSENRWTVNGTFIYRMYVHE